MKNLFLIFIFFFHCLITLGQKEKAPLYKNPKAPISERVKDLLKRMTIEEKAGQMECVWSQKKSLILNNNGEFDEAKAKANFPDGLGEVGRPNESLGKEYISTSLGPRETVILSNRIQKYFVEKTRLGIPVLFHEESLHGNQAKDATHFPSHLGLASTWNEKLVSEIYNIVAEEVRARGAQHVLAPVVDLGLDPRWGRTEETLGEDPYLASRLAVAEVKAYQGEGPLIGPKKVIATLKHFGVHGMPEGGVNVAPSFVDERTLRQVYFPSFKACVQEAGALAVMPTYNEISGVPAHMNKWMLHDILRNEWGFKGMVVSDYHGISDLFTLHHVAKDTLSAAGLAIKAGVDLETPYDFAYSKLPELVKKGIIEESLMDSAVSRILYAKFICGLFENPYNDPETAAKIIGSEKNRKVALKAAHETMVLLKNTNNLLPLDVNKYKKIAVIGPNANKCILGGYSNEPKNKITPLEGIRQKYAGKAEVFYSEGCRITDEGDWFSDSVVLSKRTDNLEKIKAAVDVAKSTDVVLLFIGGNEGTSREGWAKNHLGDLPDLELLGEQNELVKALAATGKPIAAFVFSGPPLSFKTLNETVPSIVQCWYLGQETGYAVADLIAGEINPSGKLPISIPRSVGHIPSYYNYKPSARRGFLFNDIRPLYPFGFGLSYTTFEITNPELSKNSIGMKDSVTVSLRISNKGKIAGAEVVQLYIRDIVSSVTRPVKELKGFQKVWLNPGEIKQISFKLSPEVFKFYNINMDWVLEPGDFEIMVGNSSQNLTSLKLEIK